MTYIMEPYDNALEEILKKGKKKKNRTGVDTYFIAGMQQKYDLTEAFPVITGRKVYPKSVFAELVWFLSGSTNNNDLISLGAKFWTPWVDKEFEDKHGFDEGDFGPIYGWQLRHQGGNYKEYYKLEKEIQKAKKELEEQLKKEATWDISNWDQNCCFPSTSLKATIKKYKEEIQKDYAGFDQLMYIENELKNNLESRRILFSLWNMNDYHMMRLAPCHFTYQVIYDGDEGLTGILTQRSCDFWLGIPANVQFYSALTVMFAKISGLKAIEFVHNTNDSHLYENQIEATEKYLSLEKPDSPTLDISVKNSVLEYTVDDLYSGLKDYKPLSAIKVDPVV